MKVDHYEIPPELLNEVEQWMRQPDISYACGELIDEIKAIATRAADAKLERVATRLADRLLQKHRKAGNIRMATRGLRGRWSWNSGQ